jgi:hypothetical protein
MSVATIKSWGIYHLKNQQSIMLKIKKGGE